MHCSAATTYDAPLHLDLSQRWLTWHFAEPQRTASWAIVGGGLRTASSVAWHQITDACLRPPVNPVTLLQDRLQERGLGQAVGLLTSCSVAHYAQATVCCGAWTARCVVTVGLGNALRAGDLPGPTGRIGTINLVCQVSHGLTDEASLEALALCAEARTLAVREAHIASTRSGALASGTGTDCIVVASPAAAQPRERYAGKHTGLGHAIGKAVYDATQHGVAGWLARRGL